MDRNRVGELCRSAGGMANRSHREAQDGITSGGLRIGLMLLDNGTGGAGQWHAPLSYCVSRAGEVLGSVGFPLVLGVVLPCLVFPGHGPPKHRFPFLGAMARGVEAGWGCARGLNGSQSSSARVPAHITDQLQLGPTMELGRWWHGELIADRASVHRERIRSSQPAALLLLWRLRRQSVWARAVVRARPKRAARERRVASDRVGDGLRCFTSTTTSLPSWPSS